MPAARRANAACTAPVDAAAVSTASFSAVAGDFFSVKFSGEPDSGALTSVTGADDMGVGNTYTAAGGLVGSTGRKERALYCRNATTDGTCIITATMAGAVPVYGFSIHVTIFTGIIATGDPVAATSGAVPVYGGRSQTITGSEGANNQSTGSLGTPADSGCAIDSMAASGSWPDNFTTGTGLTSSGNTPNNPSTRSGYAIQTIPAAVNAQYSNDLGGDVVTLAVGYKPAADSTPVALAGTGRGTFARLLGQLAQALGLRPTTLRSTPARLRGTLTSALALRTATLRATPARLRGTLTQAKPLDGTGRSTPARLIGQLSQALAMTSVGRATQARLSGVLTLTNNLLGTVRATQPRLYGQLTQTLALRGTMRMTSARVLATPAVVNLPLAGVMRMTSGRMFAVATSTIPLQGTIRAGTARGLGASLTISVYAAECKGPTARLFGQLTQSLALRSTMRAGLVRLHGNLTPPGVIPLNGTMRMTSARGYGVLVQALAMSGTMRATPVRLFGQVGQSLALASTLRTGTPRLYGQITTAIPSTLELFGVLRVPGAVLLGALLDLGVEPEPEPSPVYAGKYAAEHASALADIRAAGFACTFTRRNQSIDDLTGQLTETITTIDCAAMETEGDEEKYKALGLILGAMPALLVAPVAYPLRAYTEEFIQPGDTVPMNGQDWTLKANTEITGPDGFVIVAECVVAR